MLRVQELGHLSGFEHRQVSRFRGMCDIPHNARAVRNLSHYLRYGETSASEGEQEQHRAARDGQ